MKILRRKSKDVLLVTEQDGKLCDKAVSIKATEKNWITLDTIGLAVLIMFQRGLFPGPQIGDVNHREKVDK